MLAKQPCSKTNKHYASFIDERLKIDKNIYSIFKSLERNEAKIVDILLQLDLSLFRGKKYRKIKFSYSTLLRAIILMKIKNIRFKNSKRIEKVCSRCRHIALSFEEI